MKLVIKKQSQGLATNRFKLLHPKKWKERKRKEKEKERKEKEEEEEEEEYLLPNWKGVNELLQMCV